MENSNFKKEDFLFFKEKIFDLAGIHLTEKKVDLVRTRVESYLKKSSLNNIDDLKAQLQAKNPKITEEFINILTTNKTDFFREPEHFNFIQEQLLPYWIKSNKQEIKIWCCASSTGEEPYSLALLLDKIMPQNLPWKILASDIDTQVLKTAAKGVYKTTKLSEIPEDLQKGVKIGHGDAEGWFKINDKVHSKIKFIQHNLIDNSYPGDEIFDLISCRNVLIYFEKETISTLVEKLYQSLKPDGYLFIGHSESIQGNQHLYKTIQPAVYKKVD